MRNSIFVGLAAGLVSAVVLIAAAQGSIAGLIALIFLAPLPVIIAGLGWGWAAAMVASALAALTLSVLVTPRVAMFHLLAVGLPMVASSYLLLLNRAAPQTNATQAGASENTGLEWYPPGRVLGLLAVVAGTLAAASLLTIATSERELEAALRAYIDKFGIKPPSETDAENFAKLMARSFAPVAATFWMTVACFNLWLGGLITYASGQLARPWPDLSHLMLPREAPLFFLAAVAGSFLQGYPGLIALGFASVFLSAYLIIGLAIIHNITRGNDARVFILIAVYLSLLILNPFSGIIISMIGIAEPVSPIRRRFATDDTEPDSGHGDR